VIGTSLSRQDLGAEQLRLVERASAFLAAEAERGADVAINPECYLSGWSQVPGRARLRRLAGATLAAIDVLVARVKDALNVARLSGYEVVGRSPAGRDYEQLVVSWCRSSDFAAEGSYSDRYFRTSSREIPGTLWFLIALDQKVPERLDANIRVFRRRPGTPRFDVLHLLRSIVRAFGAGKSDTSRATPALSATVGFAQQIVAAILAQLEPGRYRRVVLPYEAQPFQHAIYNAAKRRDHSVTTVGYLHSAPPPLPTDLIRRAGAPEILLVHGRGQADILERHLGWRRSTLHTIPSLRYRRDDAGAMAGFIFLPYSFDDAHVIERVFRDFLVAAGPATVPPLKVRNHPVMQDSARHLRLQRQLEAVMQEHSDRFVIDSDVQPVSVFIGATAAILEALERGVAVLHICSQPLTEAHTSAVWPDMKVQRLGEYLFRYQLPDRGVYIDFGAEVDMFKKYVGRQLLPVSREQSP
jgi:hypothetical protein